MSPEVRFQGLIRDAGQLCRPGFGEVAKAANGRWHGLLAELGVSTEHLVNRHGPCPGCGGRDRFRFDDLDGRGTWICGGAGNLQAGDGFDLLRHVYGWTAGEALGQVARVLGMDQDRAALLSRRPSVATRPKAPASRRWRSICPIPEEALETVGAVMHPTLGRPVRWWAYETPRRSIWSVVARFESGTSKALRPLSYGYQAEGQPGWAWRRTDYLIPWNLSELHARPEAPVVVAEGEKAAEAAKRLLPECVASCHHGGASQAHLTCWRDLAGRDVTILPDDDAASVDQWVPELATVLVGTGARVSVAEPFRAEGAELIRGEFLDHTGTGGDAADLPATAEGSARLRALVHAARPFAELFPHVAIQDARAWAADRDASRIRRAQA